MTFYERRGSDIYTEPRHKLSEAKLVCKCESEAAAEVLVEKLNALPEYVRLFDEACDIGGDAVYGYTEVDEVFNSLREICDLKP